MQVVPLGRCGAIIVSVIYCALITGVIEEYVLMERALHDLHLLVVVSHEEHAFFAPIVTPRHLLLFHRFLLGGQPQVVAVRVVVDPCYLIQTVNLCGESL